MRRFQDGGGNVAKVFSLPSGVRLRVRHAGVLVLDRTFRSELAAVAALQDRYPRMREERK